MKRSTATTAAVMGLLVALGAGDVMAGQGKGGKGKGMRNGTGTATRPAGAQRRDGTFLTTGTTANGSTTRPGKGNGTMDGTRVAPAPPTPVAQQ